MAGNVWVLAEHWRGRSRISPPRCWRWAGSWPTGFGVPPRGGAARPAARRRWRRSWARPTRVLYVDHPALAEPSPSRTPRPWRRWSQQRQPRVVLVPLTNVTLGPARAAAGAARGARWSTSAGTSAVADGAAGGDVPALRRQDGDRRWRSPRRPWSLGDPARARARPTRAGGRHPRSRRWRSTSPPSAGCASSAYVEPEAGDVDITQQDVLVGGRPRHPDAGQPRAGRGAGGGAGRRGLRLAPGDRPGLAAADRARSASRA